MQPSESLNGLFCVIETIRIKENSPMARLAAWKLGSSQVAMVIGETIHLHNTSREEFLSQPRWLRHELEHVRQFRQYGMIRFLAYYLWETVCHGYFNNRFEAEARQAENG